MSQRLFSVPKVGLFLETIVHATEKRQGDDVKIVTLSLRVQPFDAKLATAVDDGVSPESGVKATLFNMNNAEPKAHLRRVDFGLNCPRQQLSVFASPDTNKESIALDHVRITATYVRTQKDVNGYAFCFKASFGPLGRRELEFIQEWHLGQKFVTFEEAEPSLEFDEQPDAEDEGSEADVKARESARPLEWDDDGSGTGKPAPEETRTAREIGSRRTLHSHQSKKKAAGKPKAAKKSARTASA